MPTFAKLSPREVEEMRARDHAITIGGKHVSYELKSVDIYSVDYYLDNPRVNYVISKFRPEDVTPEVVESALHALDSTRELINSIEENGGLLEPVVVLDGKVIEGNTRLCAYRRLHKRTKDERWRYIRAQVIIEALSPKEVFTILSSYHIRGRTPWDAYEKAACIAKMLEQGQTMQEVAKIVGHTPAKVESMLRAYEAMRAKYLPKVRETQEKIIGDPQELRKYSYFEAFYLNKELAKRAEATPAFVDQFTDWLVEGRIPRAQDVRMLHEVLENTKARKEFESSEADGAFKDAVDVLELVRPEKVDGFYKKMSNFRELIREANVGKIRHEIALNPEVKRILRGCWQDLQKFCKDVGLDGVK